MAYQMTNTPEAARKLAALLVTDAIRALTEWQPDQRPPIIATLEAIAAGLKRPKQPTPAEWLLALVESASGPADPFRTARELEAEADGYREDEPPPFSPTEREGGDVSRAVGEGTAGKGVR